MQKVLQETRNNYRLYCLQNMYLQGIQAGIQSLHTLGEMIKTYTNTDCNQESIMVDWAESYKTVVILNGGDSNSLLEIKEDVKLYANLLHLPWASFKEEGIGGCITNIGIILPEYIYKMDLFECGINPLKQNRYLPCSLEWTQYELASLVQSKRLMN